VAEVFLSRLALRTRSRDVQRDLADCYAMHRRVMLGFPDTLNASDASDAADEATSESARERYGVLFRVERQRDSAEVVVQSAGPPDWSRLPQGYLHSPAEVKEIGHLYAHLRPGMTLRFRLYANPTRRVGKHNTVQADVWRGKRVEVRGEEELLEWLGRKGEQSGFRLVGVRARPISAPDVRMVQNERLRGLRPRTGRMTFGAALFEGQLSLVDVERFRRALERGIGSGKAFGFGLLSVAPPRVPEEW
jgi:CRISPR system Cascade subunit CasE